MSSQQLNFFATVTDESLICEAIIEAFPDGLLIIPERGLPEEMHPRTATCASELVLVQIHTCLIPTSALKQIRLEDASRGQRCVDFRSAPVVEYIPSKFIAPGTVRAGRIAYFYNGDHPIKQQVARLLRRLKKAARKVEGSAVCWIFEHAQREADFLSGCGNTRRPNPMKKRHLR